MVGGQEGEPSTTSKTGETFLGGGSPGSNKGTKCRKGTMPGWLSSIFLH